MYGPANILIPRVAIKDHYVKDILIRKGSYVNCFNFMNMGDSENFDNPLDFKPERWLQENSKKENRSNPFNFIPFSSGPRNCIGQHMAIIEAKVLLINFIL